jgi:hypothetical protein
VREARSNQNKLLKEIGLYNNLFSGGLEKPKDTGVANLLSAMAKCAKLTPKSTSMAAADSAHH